MTPEEEYAQRQKATAAEIEKISQQPLGVERELEYQLLLSLWAGLWMADAIVQNPSLYAQISESTSFAKGRLQAIVREERDPALEMDSEEGRKLMHLRLLSLTRELWDVMNLLSVGTGVALE